jgi:Domain of unknown function (DUF6249)
MKTVFLWVSSLALAGGVFAQIPTASPPPTAVSQPTAAGTVASPSMTAPAASPSASTSPESALERSIAKKHKKHFNFTIGDQGSDSKTGKESDSDIPDMVVPIVAVVFLTVFGAPVLIVAVIMYFGFSKNRMMHRTVRMMVEKGQPVPAALLAPPAPAQRQRSDVRRGVVLVMVGLGIMLFLGAVNDWEGGAWALGIIPFLIGAGYLLVWKLEGPKAKTDNPPPLP